MVDFQSRDTDRGESTDDPESAASDPPAEKLGFAVVSVGTGLTIDADPAGDAVVDALGSAGTVVTREVIDDRYDGVQSAVGTIVDRSDVDVVLTVGGTGVAPSDVTVEAVEPMLDKRLPGVGELIRRRSADERGTAAIRTRATGGVIEGVPLFCLPGEPGSARTATREVVVPEAAALADIAAPDEPGSGDV